MIKLLKIILCAIVLFLAFLLGVRYSEPTKNFSNWIFEDKPQEIEFDEIKEQDQSAPENTNQIDENAPQDNSAITTDKKAVTIENSVKKTDEKAAVPTPAATQPTKAIEVKTTQEPAPIKK